LEHMHSPYLMRGMKEAVERIRRAVANKEDILIYGDYDVDGTTAVVILKTAIERIGGTCDFHVPHRIKEGYGIREDRIELAAAAGVTLVISVDTGIRAFDAAITAERLGLDLIVTDHHLPDHRGVPRALAVLNPNQSGCEYPCKDLCGAAVAFKLAQALFAAEIPDPARAEKLTRSFLKMVAIATIADCMPLTGENRVFTKLGLEELRRPVNAGLRALFAVSDLNPARKRLRSSDIGFRIGPRINAAGRMEVASEVIELFTCGDEARARELAKHLDDLNTQRQHTEKQILREIDDRLATDPDLRDAYCLVIDGDGWHRGVVGITASRVVEKTCRPALVISRDPATGEAHGSGRSIPAFHLLEGLESCSSLFTRFGGHAHAVGFALESARITQLRAALDAYARTKLTPEDFTPELDADLEVSLAELTDDLLHSLRQLEPFGIGNEEPVLIIRDAKLVDLRQVKDVHAKLRLFHHGSRPLDAMAWRMHDRTQAEELRTGELLDVAVRISESDHPDFAGLQLELLDWQLKREAAVSAYSS
ncbi:MAG: single-stranded-DNA-specific exonuclease RecJ, partial [Acidobacteriales bacterium]|nr:single-stranded-DNA-specific exonuclease RecJ [Terriglobales bacterium]